MTIETKAKQFAEDYARARAEIAKVYVGQETVVEQLLRALFAGGHALLEGVPGLGKTLLVRTISRVFALTFSRIQFTPDLMPTDIIGTNMIFDDARGHKAFEFAKGPVFANVILADEINRATPKTQSALLEAMQEHSVSVGGTTYALAEPFFVLATQNPIEMEGTYPLPEAQVDRFLAKIFIHYPGQAELLKILDETTEGRLTDVRHVLDGPRILEMRDFAYSVPVATHVKEAAVRIVYATHPESDIAPEAVKKYVRYGASPRGAQALILTSKVDALVHGRMNVATEDLERNLLATLRHRIILNFEGEAEGVSRDALLQEVFAKVAGK
jgi:MoxR-like ATPase